jgi:hypothetical protein
MHNNLEKELVPYTESLELKELGFEELCFARFNNDGDLVIAHTEKYVISNGFDRTDFFTQAPTYRQVFRWFRREYRIEGFIHKAIEGSYYFVIKRIGNNEDNMYEFTKSAPKQFGTYEEAELECIKKLIEIVKQWKS